MDAILFYGEGSRSDASRRQVRSAAAQHSHRIGPRKPKSSKKPKSQSDSGHQKRRSLKANTLNTITSPSVPSAAAAAVGQAGKLAVAPAHPYSFPPPHQVSPPRPSFSAQTLPPPPLPPPPPTSVQDVANAATVPTSIGASSPTGLGGVADREKELKRQAAQARFHEIQAIQRQHEAQAERDNPQTQLHHPQQQQQQQTLPAHPASAYTASSKLPPLQVPAPPPLVIERIEQPQPDTASSSRSRNNSQASPLSPSTRLPQYSWTEYPRYGLGFNHLQSSSLQMLAQVAVAERDASESRHPSDSAPAQHDVPGFRQFSASAQQPAQPNRPRSPLQSGRLHELPIPADRAPGTSVPEAGPQLAPFSVQSLTDRPPLPANSTFGQFLQSAINGHERVEEVHQGVTIASPHEPMQDKKPHFSSG